MSRTVALVTDSTASLPAELAAERDITVVPLQVVVGATSYDEGAEGGATPDLVSTALRAWAPVSTSRPSPEVLLEAYRRAAAAGATEVLSVHLSGEISGTVESARLAARLAGSEDEAATQPPLAVTVVDSRQVGMGTGFAVLAAAEVLDAGGSLEEAAAVAQSRAAGTTSVFYVDTLEYLRRGGRVGAAAAFVGSALAVKPLLRLAEGRIVPSEKVRTSGRAVARLEEVAVEAAGDGPVDVAVAHLGNPERADALSGRLAERLAGGLEERAVVTGEVGAVLGAHVGPGMLAVVVAPRN